MPYKDPEKKRAYLRKRYASLSPEKKRELQEKANNRANEIRRYVDSVKMERGCIDCGYKEHPAALDFDHVHGEKVILVSFAKSKKRADEEMAKCEVRCANCHRIKSWERRWRDTA